MEARMTASMVGRVPRAGWWGLIEFLEPRVRRLVAERLGVDEAQLEPAVSLVDDLAADSLDTLEVALAVEAEFGISVPEAAIADVRSYGDLVAVVTELVRAQYIAPARTAEVSLPVQARLVPGNRAGSGSLERAEWLTPYAVQSIVEDALRGGPGSRLDLTLPATADEAVLLAVRRRFACLGERGLDVRVARAGGSRAGRTPAAA